MGKIKGWKVFKQTKYSKIWKNTSWLKTEDKWATIEEVSIGKSSIPIEGGYWNFLYFINDGKKTSFQKNGFKTEKEVKKYAVKYMTEHSR